MNLHYAIHYRGTGPNSCRLFQSSAVTCVEEALYQFEVSRQNDPPETIVITNIRLVDECSN